MKADGTIDELNQKWFFEYQSKQVGSCCPARRMPHEAPAAKSR